MGHEEYKRRRGRTSGMFGSVLTVTYAVFIISYLGAIFIETIGEHLASAFVMPHMACILLAAVFSCVGFFARKRWAMLTAAILMTVSAVLVVQYAPLVIVQAVLLFISCARMCDK